MATAKSIQRRLPDHVVDKDLEQTVPASVLKSYLMLQERERLILRDALQEYRPGQKEPIHVGGKEVLKPVLRLSSQCRLTVEEFRTSAVMITYTTWLDTVQVLGTEKPAVYVKFSSHIEPILLALKKYLFKEFQNGHPYFRLRSQYSVRLYNWARPYAKLGSKRVSVNRLRRVLGLDEVTDKEGNIIQLAQLRPWANLRQRALDVALKEINNRTDLRIQIESMSQVEHRRITSVNFKIAPQGIPRLAEKNQK
ncbi:MAG: replication initiation protein [Verrucomicrobia bacterium]|nr:replication initiation protein [Verrucomicrobiota bacterium]